jgi:hypothetical protein
MRLNVENSQIAVRSDAAYTIFPRRLLVKAIPRHPAATAQL